MKRFLSLACIAMLLCQTGAFAQRLCGAEILKNAMIARNPEFAQYLEQQRESLQGIADAYKLQAQADKAAKTTNTASAIPVIFHFIIDSAQFNEIGGTAGIIERIDSQIVVLNRDYNRQNSDSTLILAGFKPLYANVGIHFGLAHTAPTGDSTPGYELKIVSGTGFIGVDNSFMDAKDTATNAPNPPGLNSWNVSKYLNIWCVNFQDPQAPGLLGITVPESFVEDPNYNYPGSGITEANKGVCVQYNAVGKRRLSSDSYIAGIDLGRTLTHEFGHVFEIWHVWGDDGGLCPWNGGSDDGMADTPPQSNYTYGDPVVPDFDGCKYDDTTNTQPYGIMCMNYMDYTNDNAMHMFTLDQAAEMDGQTLSSTGESHSLTQNPGLLLYPGQTGIAQVNNENNFTIAPNPTTGIVHIIFSQSNNSLQQVSIVNMLGQEVQTINAPNQSSISVNLSGMSKGIYFVRCSFASGVITRKVVLQ